MPTSNQTPSATPEHQIGPCHVWVKPAANQATVDGRTVYGFSWSEPWQVCRRLLPQSCTRTAGSTGLASFTLLQRTREENGTPYLADLNNVVRGAYVAVTLGIDQQYNADGSEVDPTWDASAAVWYGWITDISATVSLASPADEVGTVSAQELGALLDAQQVRGWLGSGDPSGATRGPLLSPPTANFSVSNGVIVGNAVDSGFGYKVFAADAADCGTASSNYWSRWELLKHIILLCKPPALTLSLIAPSSGIEGFLSDTTVPEVFELDGLTFKGALDMLLPRSRGFGWYLTPTDSAIEVNVYSHDPDGSFLDDGNGNLAANTPVTVASDPAIISLGRNESAGDDYDEIVIRGDHHVICGSLDASSFVPGWSDAAETAFRSCSGVILPASPDPSDKLKRYQEYRSAPGLDRVFSAFRFESDAGELNKADGSAFFPLIIWNGSTLSLANFSGTAPVPSLPTARVERSIPWPKGLQPDGTDYRSAQQVAQPEYMSPRLFRYTATPPANDAQTWVNLLVPSQSAGTKYVPRDAPAVHPDERSCGLLVKFSYGNEALARNHWTDGVDALSFNQPSTPNTGDAFNPCIDWEWLVFTLAINSDQRVEVTKTKPGISGDQVRRRLVIEENGLAFWFVWRDAILALTQAADGSMQPWYPTISNTDPTAAGIDSNGYVVRNGYPLAERFANMVSAWVFRPRVSISVRMAWPDYDRSAWLDIGTMLGSFGNQSVVNTVIEAITYTLTPSGAGVSFSTTLVDRPALPRIPALSGMTSPSGAGQVSVSLGGTVPQVVQRHEARLARLESLPQPAIIQARPAIIGDDGLYQVTQTAHGFAYGDVVAYTGSTWALADANSTYEPTGLVLAVDSDDVFRVAFNGRHYAPDLTSISDLTLYYINPISAGDYIAQSSVIPGALPSTGAALRAVFRSLKDGYIEVLGVDTDAHDHLFEYAANVLRPSAGFSLGDTLTYDPDCFGSGVDGWKAGSATGSGAATSVLGRATGTAGTRADIAATADGQVLARAGGTLQWTTIGGGLLPSQDLEQLNDVAIVTSPDSRVADDFLTWDGAAWVNRNLGPALCLPIPGAGSAVQSQFALDGGTGAPVTSVIAVGKTGSRFYIAGGAALDIEVDGTPSNNSEHACRLLSNSAGVQFFDRVRGAADGSTSGALAGTQVMEWGSSATASSRYFRFLIDVQFQDTGSNQLKLHAQGSGQWRWLDSSSNNYLDFLSALGAGGPAVRALGDIDLGGRWQYLDFASSSTDYIHRSSGTGRTSLTVNGVEMLGAIAGTVALGVGGSPTVIVGSSTATLAFFNAAGHAKTSLLSPSGIVTSGTASTTYTATEANMINNLKTDVTNLRASLASLQSALNGYGLV